MIAIGKFLSTHGLNGGIKLNSYCEVPGDIFNIKLYDGKGNNITCKKTGNTSRSDMFIVTINDISSIEGVEMYKNQEIFLKREEMKETEEDEVYVEDLIGIKVICEDLRGIVSDFYNYGAGDIIEITWDHGEKEDVPFTTPYVAKIDKKNSTIYVEKPTYI
jgi:16S rRNA processing protein RimM